MKIPQNIEGAHREGRTDLFGYDSRSGVEPLWLKKWRPKCGFGLKRRRMCLAKCANAPGGSFRRAKCKAKCSWGKKLSWPVSGEMGLRWADENSRGVRLRDQFFIYQALNILWWDASRLSSRGFKTRSLRYEPVRIGSGGSYGQHVCILSLFLLKQMLKPCYLGGEIYFVGKQERVLLYTMNYLAVSSCYQIWSIRFIRDKT